MAEGGSVETGQDLAIPCLAKIVTKILPCFRSHVESALRADGCSHKLYSPMAAPPAAEVDAVLLGRCCWLWAATLTSR